MGYLMSDFFGDFDDDDAFDTEPPDPLQVAIKLHKYRRDMDPNLPRWDDLDEDEKQIALALMFLLIAWLRRQGAIR